ncbi:MAG: replicative DNA helicase [Acidobacteria bacterium]|nr:MAG: replicative DNA helicase [Acidobacteriota bacterium]
MPTDITLERGLPHNIEAERCVLGAIILDNALINQAIEMLSREDFYSGSHKLVFENMLSLTEKSKAIDFVTLTEEIRNGGQLEAVGGASFVSSLIDGVPRLANLEFYARIVHEKSTLRNLIKKSNEIINTCYDQQEDVDAILDSAEKVIFDLAESKIHSGFVSINEIAKKSFKKIETAASRKQMVTGIPTGYTEFDNLTSGLQNSDLVIIAARPSMGKTALSLNIATHAAVAAKKTVGLFSLEMSSDQLLLRILCSEARIDAHKLRTGFLNKEEWSKIAHVLGVLTQSKIFIDDTAGLSLLEMRAKARRLKAEHGLDLLIVDYLQLMSGGKARFESRQQEISSISRGLKGLAKELDIPLIALSQLSRAPETRSGDHRPQLSDLRESGSIEQDADLVAFIFREEIYKQSEENKGIAEIIIGKQRNGPIGSVKLAFLREFTRFENLWRE